MHCKRIVWNSMENIPIFKKCSDWISNPLMICIVQINYFIHFKWQLMFVKSFSNFLWKLKIRNTRLEINQWDLFGEFISNGESLSIKIMKTIILDRAHEGGVNEITSTFNSIITCNLFTANTSSKPHCFPYSCIPCNNQSVDPQNKSTKSSLPELHKQHENQEENWHKVGYQQVSTFVFLKRHNEYRDLICQLHPP